MSGVFREDGLAADTTDVLSAAKAASGGDGAHIFWNWARKGNKWARAQVGQVQTGPGLTKYLYGEFCQPHPRLEPTIIAPTQSYAISQNLQPIMSP